MKAVAIAVLLASLASAHYAPMCLVLDGVK